MNLLEAMGKVMVNLDEVSSKDLTADMVDYENRIYEVFDSVQKEIAVISQSIIKKENFTTNGNGEFTIPDLCINIIGVSDLNNRNLKYTEIGNTIYDLPVNSEVLIKYVSYPEKIDFDTPKTYEFEIPVIFQEPMIYGVCAGLCINDEPELYTTYLDRYNVYMSNLLTQNKKANILGGVKL